MAPQQRKSATAIGSTEEAIALMRELSLTPTQGSVGVGVQEWFVMIWEERQRPPITRWLGWPVRYYIGGGAPRAY